jgi:hypothetical protein
MKYNKNLFEKGNSAMMASEIRPGMILALKNQYFYVDDIDQFYIDKDLGEKSENEDEDYIDDCYFVKDPKNCHITFYDEDDREITNVPGTAFIIAYCRIKGKHNPIKTNK